ncbi:SixA phosphatase family protein [Microvirga thermotolerans]|uniref:Histidine phosphatase family protein n=1 Tax=Microvirga thermotolerans TaxID=2651334 RepID=A0A5P9JXM2_9HYPH|nr:histidine phosphatase family protein [Microvirga thermotolerans]QFU16160.1 histidine phosphatase family protein [Microvirga thermotolerans]
MLRLLLLRHAKSSWPAGVLDVERPLSPRGRKAAVLMGDYLKEERLVPDLALISPARRTEETWDLVQPALGEVECRREPRLYEATAARLLTVVQEVNPVNRRLLMIGHNPGFEDLAKMLIGDGTPEDCSRLSGKLPTAGLVVVDFPGTGWEDVKAHSGRLERFVTPKSLGAGEDD